jgi:hypothetical protein
MQSLIRNTQLFYVIVISFTFPSCQKEEVPCVATHMDSSVTLIEGETIGFPLDSLTSPNSSCIQLFNDKKSGRSYLAMLNQPDHSVYLFNYELKTLHSKIQFQRSGIHSVGEVLNGFYIHTLDSIFVVSRYVLSIVSENGIPYYQFSFLKENRHNFTSLPQIATNRPARLLKGTLYMSAVPDKDPFNKRSFKGEQCMIALDLKKRRFHYSMEFPSSYQRGIYGPNFMMVSHCINEDKNTVTYSFPTETCIYNTNSLNDVERFYAGSSDLPKITPMQKVVADYDFYTRFYVQSPSYGSIYYNAFLNLYYRFAEYPRNDEDFNSGKVWKNKSIIVLDSLFRKVNETKVSELLSSTMCYTNSCGLYIARSTQSEDTLYFTNFSFKQSLYNHENQFNATILP